MGSLHTNFQQNPPCSFSEVLDALLLKNRLYDFYQGLKLHISVVSLQKLAREEESTTKPGRGFHSLMTDGKNEPYS